MPHPVLTIMVLYWRKNACSPKILNFIVFIEANTATTAATAAYQLWVRTDYALKIKA